MIEVKYTGRLGNQLFIYAAGRIMAEEMGYRLSAPPIEGFEGTKEFVDGECHHEPVQEFPVGSLPRVAEIVADRRPRKISLMTYMQNYEHIKGKTQEVRNWYRQPEGIKADPEAVLVHIRLGDFVELGWALSMDYYTKIIDENFRDRRIVVMTDDPKSPHLSALDKYNMEIHQSGDLEQFRLLTTAKNLIIGTSTFSWWAAFISDARVFAPIMKRGYYFARFNKNERYIVEEERYTYVKDVETISKPEPRPVANLTQGGRAKEKEQLDKKDKPLLEKANSNRPKVILTCFAGRKRNMEILLMYTDRLNAMGLLDEMHIWDFSKDEGDGKWLSDGFQRQSTEGPEEGRRHPYARLFSVQNKGSWLEYYGHYTRDRYPEHIIIKSDDDIVFVDVESFERFIKKRTDDQETLLMFPSIVNNGICVGHQWERGYIDKEFGPFPKNSTSARLYGSPRLVASLHRQFVEKNEEWMDRARKTDETIKIPIGQRISINFFAILSKDLFAYQMLKTRVNDEGELTQEITKTLGRHHSINMNMTVAHLSFSTQRNAGMNENELVEMYKKLAGFA